MRNLEFRLSLLMTLCWTSGIADRSDNGYFYDIPRGAPFNIPSKPIHLPQRGHEFTSEKQTIEILPAVLVFEDTKFVKKPFELDFKQQLPSQQISRNPEGLQPMEFELLDGSEKRGQQICGPEPIVAQLSPDLMRLANERPITRVIKTCDANNNCKSITLQSDPNRRRIALAQPHYNQYLSNQVQPKALNRNTYLALERPPNRRLIEYTEIERESPYN